MADTAFADVLRNGPSPLFCGLLANILAPPPGKKMLYGLRLIRTSVGMPQKATAAFRDREIGRFMAERIDGDGARQKVVIAEAKERFGIARSAALEALKRERHLRELELFYNEKTQRSA